MQVQDIYVYPVKSLGGISQESSTALERGFQFDRRWMLVDEDGKFITQRVEHKLALLMTNIQAEGLRVWEKASPSRQIIIPTSHQPARETNVAIWNDEVVATETSAEVDLWFSNFLGKRCRLVFIPETGRRPVDPNYAERDEQVSFADAFPYLLISQASLDDLNRRLAEPVPMNRFRPNLVISAGEAFQEDRWSEVKIGEVLFKVAKPCARCILTTIDQATGARGKEPLYTLSKYRMQNNKVLFGQNLIALNEGMIKRGDVVEVLSYR